MKKAMLPIAALSLLLAASCAKETPGTPTPVPSGSSKYKTMSGSGFSSLQYNSGRMRKVRPDKDWKCVAISENCHPEDIVVHNSNLLTLDAAIEQGPVSVSNLFKDNNNATIYMPDWNTAWFADVKDAILSGSYTFLRVGPSTYLLGKANEVSESNFEYAITYEIQ